MHREFQTLGVCWINVAETSISTHFFIIIGSHINVCFQLQAQGMKTGISKSIFCRLPSSSRNWCTITAPSHGQVLYYHAAVPCGGKIMQETIIRASKNGCTGFICWRWHKLKKHFLVKWQSPTWIHQGTVGVAIDEGIITHMASWLCMFDTFSGLQSIALRHF